MRQKGADFWKQLTLPGKLYSLFPNVLKICSFQKYFTGT